VMAKTDRDERLSEAQERISDAVEELVSSDDWRQMLEQASKFHRYSFNNIMLICMQRPDASRVAGYRTWQSLGRQVRKGENGITILAPCTYRYKVTIDGTEETRFGVKGFTTTTVFDVTQTDGEPLTEVAPVVLNGSDSGACRRIIEQIEALGYTTEIVRRDELGSANGRTTWATRSVVIADDLEPAAQCKTLAHELAHIVLGHEAALPERHVKEVQAESVAYLVCLELGIRSDSYTFPYVARWADGDAKLVQKTADAVLKASRTILDALGAATPTLVAA
jgi:antirestriction protein ArdC